MTACGRPHGSSPKRDAVIRHAALPKKGPGPLIAISQGSVQGQTNLLARYHDFHGPGGRPRRWGEITAVRRLPPRDAVSHLSSDHR